MIISISDYEDYINDLTGYTLDTTDTDLVSILEAQESQHILTYTNQDAVPAALYPTLKAHVIALFLSIRKKAIVGDGNMSLVTSIKEGDVQINLSGKSDEQRLDTIIAELSKEGDLACFRQFQW